MTLRPIRRLLRLAVPIVATLTVMIAVPQAAPAARPQRPCPLLPFPLAPRLLDVLTA
jgi:hypothetical protein